MHKPPQTNRTGQSPTEPCVANPAANREQAASRLLEAITRHAHTRPEHTALAGGQETLSYRNLLQEVTTCGTFLNAQGVHTLGLYMDNSPAWAICDLACVQTRIPVVPIPLFFSPAQAGHLLTDAAVDTVITEQPGTLRTLLQASDISYREQPLMLAGQTLTVFGLPTIGRSPIPEGIAKITYTSGTTGAPKGVCLSLHSMEQVANSLATASAATSSDRHLCLLPLATLLENIGGIYAPLLAGAKVLLPSLTDVGMTGASGLDIRRLAVSLDTFSASSCILLPQMLQAYIRYLEAGGQTSDRLRYIAVGGAPVSRQVLDRAAALKLPVYEGYGLSEAASVTAVNTADANRPGSVGRPLPHVQIKIADDGEILVRGSLFSGYLGQARRDTGAGNFLPTGDIGYFDTDGFLYLSGRKKHIFITSFGRNVSPGWVESELTAADVIAQAYVYGEAQPCNIAILVAAPGVTTQQLQEAVAAANTRLPDYAQVRHWLLAEAPFRPQNRQLTATGRLRRNRIEQDYHHLIEALYNEEIGI